MVGITVEGKRKRKEKERERKKEGDLGRKKDLKGSKQKV